MNAVRNPADFRDMAVRLRSVTDRTALNLALADLFDRIADIRTAIFVMQDAGVLSVRTIDAFAQEDALLQVCEDGAS